MVDDKVVEVIREQISLIREELGYTEEIVRDDIFKLLRKKSKIIFFPLVDEPDLDGFHTEKYVNGELVAFVYINSAKNFEKNIFCGAHELGHVYEIEKKIVEKYPDMSFTTQEIDEVMNRFAAELLMPYDIFAKKFVTILEHVRENDGVLRNGELLKTIVALMDYFYVPYKAVVRRVHEIGFLTQTGMQKFERIEDKDKDIIDAIIYEGKYTRLRHPTMMTSFENLQESLSFAEEYHVIGKSKIRQMRQDFNIDISISEEMLAEMTEGKIDLEDIAKGYLQT